MTESDKGNKTNFTPKMVRSLCIIIALDFTVILNINIVNPLGFQLIKQLAITTEQLGWLVSVYALSAVVSGIIATAFVDKFERKKLLLTSYSGFIVGLILASFTDSYQLLLLSRIVTGVFGGISFATGIALTTDLFPITSRGKALSYKRLSFPIYQLAGIPVVLWLSENSWQLPLRLLLALCLMVLFGIQFTIHRLESGANVQKKDDLQHWTNVLTSRKFLPAYGFAFLFAAGAFMLDPYFTTYLTQNLGLSSNQLPMVFTITGIVSVIATPIIGYLSQKFNIYKLLFFSSIALISFILYFTNLTNASFTLVTFLMCAGYVSVAVRGVASGVIITSLPAPNERASFANICNALEQVGGAAAAYLGTMILIQNTNKKLVNFELAGYVVCISIVVTVIMMYFSNQYFRKLSSNLS
jgi:predicted MFS family arabinose efflux permease